MTQHSEPRPYPALVAELAASLEECTSLIRSATAILGEQRMHFAAMHGSELAKAPAALADVADRIVAAERSRAALHDRIARHLGTNSNQLTLARIASTVTGDARLRLETARRNARRAAEDLGIETSIGERLLDWSATCHENLLRRLVTTVGAGRRYDRDGRELRTDDHESLVNTTL
ncbi:MAG: hypothetical protein KDC95_00620 [Planctomycetes bacterium]|nr:hypothetical protein [Planctomycetota bacterium]